jgi:hypothetical protein
MCISLAEDRAQEPTARIVAVAINLDTGEGQLDVSGEGISLEAAEQLIALVASWAGRWH